MLGGLYEGAGTQLSRHLNKYGYRPHERMRGRDPFIDPSPRSDYDRPSPTCTGPGCPTCAEDIRRYLLPYGQGHRQSGYHLYGQELRDMAHAKKAP